MLNICFIYASYSYVYSLFHLTVPTSIPIPYAPCMEYESQHLPHKSPSHVGKYTSTMVRIWECFFTISLGFLQMFRDHPSHPVRPWLNHQFSTMAAGKSSMECCSERMFPYMFLFVCFSHDVPIFQSPCSSRIIEDLSILFHWFPIVTLMFIHL